MGLAEPPQGAADVERAMANPTHPLDLQGALAVGEALSEIGRADRKRALRLARRFVSLAAGWGNVAVLGVAKRAHAHSLRGLHRYAAALREYRASMKAFSRARLPYEGARTAIGLVDVFSNLSRYPEAVALATRTRRVFLRTGDERRASRLDVNLAHLYMRRDRSGLALARYRAAERVFERLGASLDLAVTRFNTANLLIELGSLRDALPYFESSAELWSARGSQSAHINCRLAQAGALIRLGRFDRASQMLEAAQQAVDELDEPMLQGMAALARARIALDLGRVDRAGGLFERAIDRFEHASMPWDKAETLVLRARWHRRAGRHPQAHHDLEQAIPLFEGIGQRSFAAWAGLERLRMLHSAPLPAPVRSRVKAALAEFRRAGRRVFEAEARLWLAEDGLARGVAGSREQLARVKRLLDRHPDPWLEQQWALLAARASRTWRMAMTRLERAATIADLLRARIPTEIFRASFSADQADVVEQAIELILEWSDRGSTERAFLWSERAHVPRLRTELGPSANAHTDRLERLAERRAELDQLDAQARPNARRRAEVVASLQQLYEQIQVDASRDANQTRLGAAEVARLQRGMGPDETLIEYFVGRRGIHVFVVDRKRLQHRRLDASLDRLRETVFRVRRLWDRYALEGPRGSERQAGLLHAERGLLKSLADDLLEPALDLSKGVTGPLTVVPHAWLRDLPFHAFPVAGGPLAERREFRYLLGARDRLSRMTARLSPAGPPLVVGVASPEAATAELEAREVAGRLTGATLLCGDQATRASIRARWSESPVIHVASHGVRDIEEPRLSGVGLAGGRWTAFDILEAPTRATLVVLSGCRTGDAVVWGGDEAFGLLPALIQSGARSVLVSLWPVSDDAARSWMRSFYEALASGRSVMRAWMHAAGRTRAENGSAFHWAPFALYGGRPSSEDLS